MFPRFEFLGLQIGTYGLFATVGCILCGLLFCHLLKKHNIMTEDGILLFVFVIGGVLIGGHLLYGLTNFKYILRLFENFTFEIFVKRVMYIFGGSVFYGGLFGGLLAGYIGTKVLRLDTKLCFDLITPAIPLFHTFGRIGCFFGGCCYGIESDFGFVIHGNEFIPEINGVRRFPVQLLEAGVNLILSAVMFFLLTKVKSKKLRGNLIFIYLIAYGFVRFFDEFLRGDLIRGFVGILSTSQFISIISITISTILLCRSLVCNSKSQESKNDVSENVIHNVAE